jgi:hypothetical protein
MSVRHSTELQLVAALSAMSEANHALRTGAPPKALLDRAERCLEALSVSSDLAPALRRHCESLSEQWAYAVGARCGSLPCAIADGTVC